jgi:hypothetical protein
LPTITDEDLKMLGISRADLQRCFAEGVKMMQEANIKPGDRIRPVAQETMDGHWFGGSGGLFRAERSADECERLGPPQLVRRPVERHVEQRRARRGDELDRVERAPRIGVRRAGRNLISVLSVGASYLRWLAETDSALQQSDAEVAPVRLPDAGGGR